MKAIRGPRLRTIFGGAVAIFLLTAAAPLAQAQTYDLAGDWSVVANPTGTWTYGQMDAAHNFSPFFATVDAAYLGDFVGSQPAWDGGYPMVLGKSTGTCTLDFPVGRIGGHMSNESGTRMAVRWTAPSAGQIDIAGGVWMFRDIGRQCLISLYVNGVPFFEDIAIPSFPGHNSGTPFQLTDAMTAASQSASQLVNIPVAAGDTVTVTVRKAEFSPYGDYVGIDLTVHLDTGVASYLVAPMYDQSKAHRRNSSVPIKLQVLDGTTQGNVSSTDLQVHAVSVTLVSGSAPGPLEDSGSANSDYNFRFDPTVGTGGGYIFNLKLAGYSTGTYNLNFTIGSDPTMHSVQFQVR